LDDAILDGLKRRARRHRRSLQKEVETLLGDAAGMLPPDARGDPPRALRLNQVETNNPDDFTPFEGIKVEGFTRSAG